MVAKKTDMNALEIEHVRMRPSVCTRRRIGLMSICSIGLAYLFIPILPHTTYAVSIVSFVCCSSFLTAFPNFSVCLHRRPTYIEALNPRSREYFMCRNLLIFTTSLALAALIEYTFLRYDTTHLSWYERFGIVGGNISLLLRVNHMCGQLFFCMRAWFQERERRLELMGPTST